MVESEWEALGRGMAFVECRYLVGVGIGWGLWGLVMAFDCGAGFFASKGLQKITNPNPINSSPHPP